MPQNKASKPYKRKQEFKGARGMISEMPIERKQRDAARRSPQANRRWKGEKHVLNYKPRKKK